VYVSNVVNYMVYSYDPLMIFFSSYTILMISLFLCYALWLRHETLTLSFFIALIGLSTTFFIICKLLIIHLLILTEGAFIFILTILKTRNSYWFLRILILITIITLLCYFTFASYGRYVNKIKNLPKIGKLLLQFPSPFTLTFTVIITPLIILTIIEMLDILKKVSWKIQINLFKRR